MKNEKEDCLHREQPTYYSSLAGGGRELWSGISLVSLVGNVSSDFLSRQITIVAESTRTTEPLYPSFRTCRLQFWLMVLLFFSRSSTLTLCVVSLTLSTWRCNRNFVVNSIHLFPSAWIALSAEFIAEASLRGLGKCSESARGRSIPQLNVHCFNLVGQGTTGWGRSRRRESKIVIFSIRNEVLPAQGEWSKCKRLVCSLFE